VPTRLTPDALEKQIQSGSLDRVYLLTGQDDERKSALASALADSLDEGLRAFNFDRLHGSDSKPEARKQLWTILDLAKTLPMMAPFRVILVLSAEKLLAVLKDSDGGGDELAAFEKYLKEPEPHTVVAFVAGESLDRRLKASTLLEKHATVVDCNPLAGTDGGGVWIRAEAAKEGVRIEPGAVRLLAKLAGDDIGRLRAEFERALMYTGPDGVVTEAAVLEIASGATSQDPWAMVNAIERGARGEALRELAMRLDAGEFPVMVLGQLAWFVRSRMAPAKAGAAVEAVFRTDLALKTSRGEPRILLERLVVELCS
jgi:DNA polymerase-3 subunit delta